MMFISKFNRLIRNKIVWSGFAFIVVLSFVAWQTQTSGNIQEDARNAAATLDGKPVPAAEVRSAYFHSYLYMSLMLGRPLKLTPAVEGALAHMAWRRLIALRGAQEARLTAGREEVIAAIAQQPFFQEKGQFSHERYAGFVRGFLANLRANQNQFEDHIRQEILMNKTRLMLSQAAWVAPLEIAQIYHQLYDTFIVSYVMLRHDELKHSVKISDAEARVYFAAHTNDFIIPEKMRVKSVSFPFARFVDEGALTFEDLRSYYDEHIEQFTTSGTGDLTKARSFEEVEEELREQLTLSVAIATAGDQATDFEVSLAPDRQGQAPAFEEAARSAGLAVATSAVFSLNERLAGLDVDLNFNRTAFALRPTPEEYFSHPVQGSNAVYVLAFESKTPSRLPEFSEVRATVRQVALAQAVSNKLSQVAADIYQAAASALPQGRTFAQTLRPYHLEVITTEPFALSTSLDSEDQDAFYDLVKKIVFLNAGELTAPILVEGGIIIGHVDSRIAADQSLLPSLKKDLAQYIRKRREDLAFREWQEYLLAEHKFEQKATRRKAAEEELETDSLAEEDESESADDEVVD